MSPDVFDTNANDTEPNMLSVWVAKNGFTPAHVAELRARYKYVERFKTGDVSLYEFLNISELLPTGTIRRSGPVLPLESEPNPRIGEITFKSRLGEMSLDEYLVHSGSRAQGMIVLHRGKIAFERYPGMREDDNHVWMSCSKTAASLVIAILEDEGKVAVQEPIDFYIPELKGTAWESTSVIDVLDMATGLDLEENEYNRADLRSTLSRFVLAASSNKNVDGKLETVKAVLKAAAKLRNPGEAFEYSCAITHVLGVLAEAVENRRWADIFQSCVWSKMGVEGNMLVTLTPEGTALPHGMLCTRLRDLGRYGLLYTPSWKWAARTQVVSAAYLHKIQKGGRPEIYRKGEMGNRMAASFVGDVPVSNSYQWDAVFADGDFYKSGVFGQGLYISYGRDLVIAWFSTVLATDLTHYARLIAKTLG